MIFVVKEQPFQSPSAREMKTKITESFNSITGWLSDTIAHLENEKYMSYNLTVDILSH